ncbi:MAG: glycosyltransferase [Pseudomonadota bacterium]
MKVSIALCTHNGERYLPEQLASYCRQQRLPDELVACDDNSGDATVDLLQRFAKTAPFPVRVHLSAERLGPDRNFQRAVGACQGDVIALSDQDDEWLPEKLAAMTQILQSSPLAGAVFCNAEITDEHLTPLGYDFWSRVGLTAAARRMAEDGDTLALLIKRYRVAGAMLAFRAEYTRRLLPVPAGWYYDAWFALVLADQGVLRGTARVLQRYRQHRANLIGGARPSFAEQVRAGLQMSREDYYRMEIRRFESALESIGRTPRPVPGGGAGPALAAKLAHLRRRAALPRNRLLRIPRVAVELLSGGYARYATDWRSIAVDLLHR